MASSLNIELVNGHGGDPAVSVNFVQAGDSILFDAGMLEKLSNREILKIKVIAISHTHVDHFIGFDRIIRVNVPHFRSLEVVGPKGIMENVRGKLAGYTWNLLEADQINFVIHEIDSNCRVSTFKISNNNGFKPELIETNCAQSTKDTHIANIPLIHSENGLRYELNATVVDHRMDVIAYCLTMPTSSAVKKAELAASGLKTGPWIAELQQIAKQNGGSEFSSSTIQIDGVQHSVANLANQLLEAKPGEKIMYVTDMSFTDSNLKRLKTLAGLELGVLICEANFQARDREKAVKTAHLTTLQAGLIASILKAKVLKPFHFSNSYALDFETSLKESEEAFQKFSKFSPAELDAAASNEFP